MDNIYLKHLINKIKLRESEYNNVKTMLEHYDSRVQDIVNEIFLNTGLTLADVFKPHQQCTSESPCAPESIIQEYEEYYDIIYKKLALKSHPDKTDLGNNDFVAINKAYKDKDIIKLIYYADKYNITQDQDISQNLFVMILEKRLYEIKNKIKCLRGCLAYGILIGNKEQTIQFVKDSMETHQKISKLREEINKDR